MLGIELIIGPMFSGKTSKLIKYMNIYSSISKCIVIKYIDDNRYSLTKIISHNNLMLNENITIISCKKISEINLNEYETIGIDEGHFFEDIVDICDKLAYRKKKIIITALNSSFNREPFDNISKLIAKSDKIVYLNGKCKLCNNKSCFTKRDNNSNLKILIGGSEIYSPVCRFCH